MTGQWASAPWVFITHKAPTKLWDAQQTLPFTFEETEEQKYLFSYFTFGPRLVSKLHMDPLFQVQRKPRVTWDGSVSGLWGGPKGSVEANLG